MQNLSILPAIFAICRLDKNAEIPEWAQKGDFISITRTSSELSLVSLQSAVPAGVVCDREWRCLKVEGILDFSMVGVLVSLIAPLARASVSIFAVATYDTDYLLIQEKDLERAIQVLSDKGHTIRTMKEERQY